jgi:hypothetical protein
MTSAIKPSAKTLKALILFETSVACLLVPNISYIPPHLSY